MNRTTTRYHEINRSKAKLNMRRLRAAEARHHFELLQEARLLQDHLAECWEDRAGRDRSAILFADADG